MNKLMIAIGVALALAAASCGSSTTGYYYDDAYSTYETDYWVDYSDAYVWYGYDPLYGYYWLEGATGTDAAARIAELAPQYFKPEGCVQASANGPAATLVLDHCRGPGALADVSGEVTMTYDDNAGLHIEAPALDVDGNRLSLTTDAQGSSNGEHLSVAVTTSIKGEGTSIGTVDRMGQYTMQWTHGDECLTVDGKIDDVGSETPATTQIMGYVRCGQSCPTDGEVTRSTDSRSVTLTFDGSMQASWMSDSGQTGTVDLNCASGK
jgi:hypothetical protein